jgi:trk system potassium uptake protein TrkH
MQLFAAEAPGPSADKLHPRITDTAKRLWFIYVGYTAAETLLLKLAGMNFFDAINHSLATLSTGGFSTKNASLAFWNDQPLIQYIVIFFMFLAGMNFVLSYFAFKGKVQRILKDEEFKYYAIFILLFTILAAVVIYSSANVQVSDYHPMVFGEGESSFRHALFQVVAVVTTTGFVSADFTSWTPFLTVFFFGLFFLGGSAGSTAGGIKVMRHLLIIKNGILEFKRTLHPNAIIPVRYNNKTIKEHIVYNIIAFFVLYMLLFIIGALGLGAMGLDFVSAIGGAASSLGNVGPALGSLNPMSNFNGLPDIGKWWCGFLMLAGRLELFTVLILMTPYFWKRT